jgi:DNA-binding CsgD family transcriptional regulator
VATIFDTGDQSALRPLRSAELRETFGLTPREAQIARLIASGAANAEVAEQLGISVHTVRRHVEHVLMRLGVKRRSEVASKLLHSGK